MPIRSSFVLQVCIAVFPGLAAAEELPIERLFSPPSLNGPAPHAVQLSPNGAFVTYLKPEPGDQTTYDLWALPVKGGAAHRLVEGSAVEPQGAALSEAEKGRRERQRIGGNHGVVEYKWDEAGEQILIPAAGQLYIANVRSGGVKKLGDTGGTAIDAKISPQGRYVTYVHHLYLYHSDGTLIRAITQGDWPVASGSGPGLRASAVCGVDEARKLVYFVASMAGPLEQHLYVTSYDRPARPTQITAGGGWWSVDVAKNNRSFVATYTDAATPPQTALYSIDGHRLAWIEENKLAPGHPYWPYLDHLSYPEFGTLRAEDGQTLYYSVTKPYGFDATKKYSAVVSVYGGPGVSTLHKRWSGGTDQLLTQSGYVVFRLDNRGSSNRGLKFEAPIYKAILELWVGLTEDS